MKKKFKDKRSEVEYMLKKQKIRNLSDLDDYKLDICHPLSAGIDLGARELYVALPPQIAREHGIEIVHVFETFTEALHQCKDLFLQCGITTVAMESTSIYWTTIYSVPKIRK